MTDSLRSPPLSPQDQEAMKDWPLDKLEAARETCVARLSDATARKAFGEVVDIGREIDVIDRARALRLLSRR